MVLGLLWTEQGFAPPIWVQVCIWVPAAIGLSLALLPRIKGALIGHQWAFRMHGFGPDKDNDPAG